MYAPIPLWAFHPSPMFHKINEEIGQEQQTPNMISIPSVVLIKVRNETEGHAHINSEKLR